MVVHAAFHVEMPGCQGDFRIIIPQSALRPVEKKLASGLVESGADNVEDWEGVIADVLTEVPVQCTAELGHTQMSLGDLLRLQVGSVIRLDRDPESEITVFVEGAAKFTGSISVHVGNFAVTIGQQLSPRDQGDGKAPSEGSARVGPASDAPADPRTDHDSHAAGAPRASGAHSRSVNPKEVRP
jgi:flagellar motor switch protein FliM